MQWRLNVIWHFIGSRDSIQWGVDALQFFFFCMISQVVRQSRECIGLQQLKCWLQMLQECIEICMVSAETSDILFTGVARMYSDLPKSLQRTRPSKPIFPSRTQNRGPRPSNAHPQNRSHQQPNASPQPKQQLALVGGRRHPKPDVQRVLRIRAQAAQVRSRWTTILSTIVIVILLMIMRLKKRLRMRMRTLTIVKMSNSDSNLFPQLSPCKTHRQFEYGCFHDSCYKTLYICDKATQLLKFLTYYQSKLWAVALECQVLSNCHTNLRLTIFMLSQAGTTANPALRNVWLDLYVAYHLHVIMCSII